MARPRVKWTIPFSISSTKVVKLRAGEWREPKLNGPVSFENIVLRKRTPVLDVYDCPVSGLRIDKVHI